MHSLLTFALWLPLLLMSSGSSVYTYSIGDESWISISGSSNVNSFECFSNTNFSKGNIFVELSGNDNSLNFTNASLSLAIFSFDCKNPMLNKDFYKTLGADKNPTITIELLDAKPIYQKDNSTIQIGRIKATIAVTLNNKCKVIHLPIDWQRVGSSNFRVTGSKEINMTDFGITPPTPAFGLIKVHNQISINFSMLVTANINFDPRILSELTKQL
jgi:hypothetical protein